MNPLDPNDEAQLAAQARQQAANDAAFAAPVAVPASSPAQGDPSTWSYAKRLYSELSPAQRGYAAAATPILGGLAPLAYGAQGALAVGVGNDRVNAYEQANPASVSVPRIQRGNEPPPEEQATPPQQVEAGPQVIAGGYKPAHERAVLGPTQRAALDRAVQSQERGAQQVAELEQQAATEARVRAAHDVAQADERMKQAQSVKARNMADLAQADQTVRKTVADVGTYKEDVGDLWAKSKFNTGAIRFAAALEGFRMGFQGQGGPNQFLQMQEAAIDREVAAHRAEYNAKKDKVGEAKDAYSRMANMVGVEAADEMAKAAMRDQVAAKGAEIAASKGLTDASKEYAAAMAALGAKREENIAKAVQYVQAAKGPEMLRVPGMPVPVTRAEYFGLLKDGLTADRKSADKAAENRSADLKWLSEKRAAQGLPEQEQAIATAKADMGKAGTKGIGPVASRVAESMPLLYKNLYGNDAAAREQSWSALRNAYYSRISGAAVGAKEEVRLKAQLENARTPEDRTKALGDIEDAVTRSAKNLEAAVPDAASTLRTRGAQPGGVRGFLPDGGKR